MVHWFLLVFYIFLIDSWMIAFYNHYFKLSCFKIIIHNPSNVVFVEANNDI